MSKANFSLWKAQLILQTHSTTMCNDSWVFPALSVSFVLTFPPHLRLHLSSSSFVLCTFIHSSCDVFMYFHLVMFILWCILQGPSYTLGRYIRDRENAARFILLVIQIKHLALTTRIITLCLNPILVTRVYLPTLQFPLQYSVSMVKDFQHDRRWCWIMVCMAYLIFKKNL